jgi:chromosome segregation ATPase
MSLDNTDIQYSSNDILDMNLASPEQLTTELQTLQNQVPSILDEFKKSYLSYNINPQNNDYQQTLETAKNQLNNTNSKLFLLSNTVETDTEAINKKLFILNILIQKAKKRNKELKRQLNFTENRYNVTDEMINDYKHTYNIGYLRNWGLVLSILIVGYTIFKVFKNPNTTK